MISPALLTAVDCTSHVHLVIGSNPLAGARIAKSLEVGARPILIAPDGGNVHYGIIKRLDESGVKWIKRPFEDDDLKILGRSEVEGIVDAVFVTLGAKHPASKHIYNLCTRLRIPVNVADSHSLSTFSLLSTHTAGPLQIGVTASGNGCKLASRIRREIAASLPPDLGTAVGRLGTIRRRIWEEDHAAELASMELEAEEEDMGQAAAFNKLIRPEDAEAARTRRMRWLAQICEYWPLRRLASITDADVDTILKAYMGKNPDPTMLRSNRKATIVLAGSGPGNPDLLTRATHKAILGADIVLADKLVPAAVLELVPRRTHIHIARKFPGNADKAQEELLQLGLQGLQEGKNVVRLKQGDPYIYGRGGEEYGFFRAHGYTPIVLPGITSALSAPLFAAIPATHRSVADNVLICTGTGRAGVAPEPPEYVPSRTVVFLMALHRLSALVASLTINTEPKLIDSADKAPNNQKLWPKETPCAVIERASCPDQRVIRTTLEFVCSAVEEEGSRPPGLLVVGRACEVLEKLEKRQKWVTEEGFRGFGELDVADGTLQDLIVDQQSRIVM